ncbi:MAG: chemotaxis protein CheA [Deltaproteobacteria bacterium]|nr:chemotaxis protein CheA [Deltaproteobacteria bacterium]
MDMSQYRDLFVSEARGHLNAFNELIVRLEGSDGDKATINELFRHAHSLKGMAATMGYDPVAALAHAMEGQLSRVRSEECPFVPALADLLLESADNLGEMISQVESGSETIREAAELVERLASFNPDEVKSEPDAQEPDPVRTSQPQAPAHNFRQSDTFKSIRIRTETLDHLVNITGELITNRYHLVDCVSQYGGNDFDEPIHRLTGLLRELRDEVFKARMLPFAFIAERFPRLVRDLARKQGKEISFHLDGRNIELDRAILEEITEPLVHVLRNAVDHGMEPPDRRVAAGKPLNGDIRLSVTRDKDHVDIVIEDDGCGMDPERIKSKAVEKGIINGEQAAAMTPQEALMLVCAPGLSTAESVSDVSGRGVGMDAVRTAVHSLGGVLTIQSEIGRGSRFIMRLPITVSIINALMVKSGNFEIAFPVNSIRRTLELKPAEIIEEAGQQAVLIDESYVPLRSLARLLGHPPQPASDETLIPVVICESGGSLVAFAADRLRGQQEIFVRPLGPPLSQLRGINGATVTGDGRVVFVVDTAALA